MDPELGFSIVDLGLIYDIAADTSGVVSILMTLTSPGCPMGDVIEQDIKREVGVLAGVTAVNVTVTFSPPWSPQKASADLKREFALMGIPIT